MNYTNEKNEKSGIIKPLTTIYNGYRFRSRLEARWAVFFDTLGVKFEYEKEGYKLADRCYLPDFFLPEVTVRDGKHGVWIEIKPETDSDDPEDHRYLFDLYEKTKYPAVLVYGLPDFNKRNQYQFGDRWDNSMNFCKCENCKHVKIEYLESQSEKCPKCGQASLFESEEIARAINKAKQARFEFGEGGRE